MKTIEQLIEEKEERWFQLRAQLEKLATRISRGSKEYLDLKVMVRDARAEWGEASYAFESGSQVAQRAVLEGYSIKTWIADQIREIATKEMKKPASHRVTNLDEDTTWHDRDSPNEAAFEHFDRMVASVEKLKNGLPLEWNIKFYPIQRVTLHSRTRPEHFTGVGFSLFRIDEHVATFFWSTER